MEPSSWLVDNLDLLPASGDALDVACGSGRHAIFLAERGYRVRAIDRDATKIAELAATASRRHLSIEAEVVDLETDLVDLGQGAYGVVVVVHYLHRPLFPALRCALAPGGLLLYETFTLEQFSRGHPKNQAFLLRPGELRELVAPLEFLRFREGEFDQRMVAGIVARKWKEDSRS